jgi:hypothetical protein
MGDYGAQEIRIGEGGGVHLVNEVRKQFII